MRVTAVSAGQHHSLFVTADGAAYSCGCGETGKLGHGNETHHAVPTRIEALAGVRIRAVAAGRAHSLFVAEDGGNMELVMISNERVVSPFMRYPVPHSEIAGPAFDPSGTRLYFASQAKRHRLDDDGREVRGEIFEITGPFRGTAAAAPGSNFPGSDSPALPPVADPQAPPGQRLAGGSLSLGLAAVGAAWAARQWLGRDGVAEPESGDEGSR